MKKFYWNKYVYIGIYLNNEFKTYIVRHNFPTSLLKFPLPLKNETHSYFEVSAFTIVEIFSSTSFTYTVKNYVSFC